MATAHLRFTGGFIGVAPLPRARCISEARWTIGNTNGAMKDWAGARVSFVVAYAL